MLGKARRGSLIPLGEKPGVRVKRLAVVSERSYVGVRDRGRYPKFLCECKRPVELSEISVWV